MNKFITRGKMIHTRYDKINNVTIYTSYYGAPDQKTRTYKKKGNWLELDKLAKHSLFVAKLKKEARWL